MPCVSSRPSKAKWPSNRSARRVQCITILESVFFPYFSGREGRSLRPFMRRGIVICVEQHNILQHNNGGRMMLEQQFRGNSSYEKDHLRGNEGNQNRISVERGEWFYERTLLLTHHTDENVSEVFLRLGARSYLISPHTFRINSLSLRGLAVCLFHHLFWSVLFVSAKLFAYFQSIYLMFRISHFDDVYSSKCVLL